MELSRNEYRRLVDDVADAVVEKMMPLVKSKRTKKQEEECTWVSASEAAQILGLSKAYLLSIKDAFTHIKFGDSKSARVKFRKETLIKEHMESQKERTRIPPSRRNPEGVGI